MSVIQFFDATAYGEKFDEIEKSTFEGAIFEINVTDNGVKYIGTSKELKQGINEFYKETEGEDISETISATWPEFSPEQIEEAICNKLSKDRFNFKIHEITLDEFNLLVE